MESIEFLKIMDEVRIVKDLVALVNGKGTSATVAPSCSAELSELYTALAKAQSEMEVAELNGENPYFKSRYADLSSVVMASRPHLTKNGLSVIQQIIPTSDGQNILHTRLCHASGQWVESRMRVVPPKNDIQTLGSYLTYLRRYTYAAIVGCVTGDEDDDGEVAMADTRATKVKGTEVSRKYDPKQQSYETITKEQIEELEYELQDYHDLAEEILSGLRIQCLADMPKSKFLVSIKRVREIKQAREGK